MPQFNLNQVVQICNDIEEKMNTVLLEIFRKSQTTVSRLDEEFDIRHNVSLSRRAIESYISEYNRLQLMLHPFLEKINEAKTEAGIDKLLRTKDILERRKKLFDQIASFNCDEFQNLDSVINRVKGTHEAIRPENVKQFFFSLHRLHYLHPENGNLNEKVDVLTQEDVKAYQDMLIEVNYEILKTEKKIQDLKYQTKIEICDDGVKNLIKFGVL